MSSRCNYIKLLPENKINFVGYKMYYWSTTKIKNKINVLNIINIVKLYNIDMYVLHLSERKTDIFNWISFSNLSIVFRHISMSS